MKLRKSDSEVTDNLERNAAEEIRRLAAASGYAEPVAPSDTYFANLMVRTNERIDTVTSGKALSISWLARVAVPGVVAILFFFIGLHYYVPDIPTQHNSIADAVRALPAEEFDSLLTASSSDELPTIASWSSDVFDVSNDQLADFFVTSESTTTVLEALPDQQVSEVASILESRQIIL